MKTRFSAGASPAEAMTAGTTSVALARQRQAFHAPQVTPGGNPAVVALHGSPPAASRAGSATITCQVAGSGLEPHAASQKLPAYVPGAPPVAERRT